MGYLDSLNITGSALTAERFRTDVILQNMANQNTTRTEDGGPYRRKQVVLRENSMSFETQLDKAVKKTDGGGVYAEQVVESGNPFVPVYDPEHPDADENGYVQMPNVDMLKETVDSMAASRAYDANLTVFNTVKTLAAKALEIGK